MDSYFEALELLKFKVQSQQPEKCLSYLQYEGQLNYDIQLQVVCPRKLQMKLLLANQNFKYLLEYDAAIAHHTANGCNINVGDVMAFRAIFRKR